MADDDSGSALDPAMTLGPDDPLREWADQNMDWKTGRLLQQDPQAAISSLIARGVPPPPVHADGSSALPYTMDAASGMGGADDPSGTAAPFVRQTPEGKIAGNLTSPSNPDSTPFPPGGASATPRMNPQTTIRDADLPSASSSGDKVMPRSAEDQAQDDAQDAEDEAKKKKSDEVGDALSGFSKSLAGVKALTPPKLPALGTPGAPHPNAISTPNIANLISMLSTGAVPQSVAPGLGKLLVQGKA